MVEHPETKEDSPLPMNNTQRSTTRIYQEQHSWPRGQCSHQCPTVPVFWAITLEA
eukprot:XP_001705846.1 Hypothetical protein GL50803_112315 [Giardia lamblia ATCC 50803]